MTDSFTQHAMEFSREKSRKESEQRMIAQQVSSTGDNGANIRQDFRGPWKDKPRADQPASGNNSSATRGRQLIVRHLVVASGSS